jgi:arylsulfatase
MKNNSWTLSAELKTEGAKTEGVIMAFGGVAAGIVLYLEDGVPVFDYNYFDEHTILKGDSVLPEGESTVELNFSYQGGNGEMGKGAKLTLKVDGKTVADGEMAATVPTRFGIDTFGIGEDSGQPVSFDYKAPFKFTGVIEKVLVKIE